MVNATYSYDGNCEYFTSIEGGEMGSSRSYFQIHQGHFLLVRRQLVDKRALFAWYWSVAQQVIGRDTNTIMILNKQAQMIGSQHLGQDSSVYTLADIWGSVDDCYAGRSKNGAHVFLLVSIP